MTRSIELGDRAGIVVAVACAVHCSAAPILATSIQVAGAFVSERTELAFVASSLVISGTTVVASCVRRGARDGARRQPVPVPAEGSVLSGSRVVAAITAALAGLVAILIAG